MEFFDMVIIAGLIILVIYLFRKKKTGSTAGQKSVQRTQKPEDAYSDPYIYDNWYGNRYPTPLSAFEMQTIAEKVDAIYMDWIRDRSQDHRSAVIWLNHDSVKWCVDRYTERTVPYSHTISCQADRELLANCILHWLREKHPNDGIAVQLYLDGDSLILPTN